MIPLSLGAASHSAPSSPSRNWAVDGAGTAGTWTPAKSLCRPRRDDFGDQADSRGHRVQQDKPPCSLHHPPDPPAGSRSFLADPWGTCSNAPMDHLSAASKASDQKLEELWKKSPPNKLEQLKKRIQEQKQRQQAAPWEQKPLISAKEPLPKRAVKRKVCRVGSAPPAPAYRDQRERSSARRIQTENQRQPPPKSSVLGRAAAGKGVKLPGASAWREGQKLARKLLGPPPEFPNLRSTAEEQSTANSLEVGRGFVAVPAMENGWRDKGNGAVGKSPAFQSRQAVERISTAPAEDTNQPLWNLHLPSQSHDENRHTSPEIVREFMQRKKEERKKKLLEEKKSLVEAAEVRKKRLQEVYRKQKEAVGKKSHPIKVHKFTGKTAPAKGDPQCEFEQKDAKPSSKGWTPGFSPQRSKQDRVKAIHSLSKELEEKIDVATKRLSGANWNLRVLGTRKTAH
ncbi:coiled-coil domain-containing protein 187 [Empidonax traillii]|uniref:coiled-coil domain-containing protein 187 n=1 Tax=Empidonax traillii TaxID=164674 RepID=UPI000FFD7F73|nr:coiled-coil domain-containing protein 187 [Empidonax traillii]